MVKTKLMQPPWNIYDEVDCGNSQSFSVGNCWEYKFHLKYCGRPRFVIDESVFHHYTPLLYFRIFKSFWEDSLHNSNFSTFLTSKLVIITIERSLKF